MALVIADRVKETTATTGTGTLTLDGAAAGFQSFDVIGNANTTYYVIADLATNAWEVGIGTFTLSGRTLSRDTVLASSTGSKLSLTAGSKEVFCTVPGAKLPYKDSNDALSANSFINPKTINANVTIGATDNVATIGPVTIGNGYTVTISDGGEWVIV